MNGKIWPPPQVLCGIGLRNRNPALRKQPAGKSEKAGGNRQAPYLWPGLDYRGQEGQCLRKRKLSHHEIFSCSGNLQYRLLCEKRPLYIDKLNKGGRNRATDWRTCHRPPWVRSTVHQVKPVGAYNANVRLQKGYSPFTELYINQLYSPNFHKWLDSRPNVATAL